jgi:hypothetical protein
MAAGFFLRGMTSQTHPRLEKNMPVPVPHLKESFFPRPEPVGDRGPDGIPIQDLR